MCRPRSAGVHVAQTRRGRGISPGETPLHGRIAQRPRAACSGVTLTKPPVVGVSRGPQLSPGMLPAIEFAGFAVVVKRKLTWTIPIVADLQLHAAARLEGHWLLKTAGEGRNARVSCGSHGSQLEHDDGLGRQRDGQGVLGKAGAVKRHRMHGVGRIERVVRVHCRRRQNAAGDRLRRDAL